MLKVECQYYLFNEKHAIYEETHYHASFVIVVMHISKFTRKKIIILEKHQKNYYILYTSCLLQFIHLLNQQTFTIGCYIKRDYRSSQKLEMKYGSRA